MSIPIRAMQLIFVMYTLIATSGCARPAATPEREQAQSTAQPASTPSKAQESPPVPPIAQEPDALLTTAQINEGDKRLKVEKAAGSDEKEFDKLETWQGLRFGMTLEEAKATLSAKGFTVRPSSEEKNTQEGLEDWEAKQSRYKVQLFFRFKLRFQSDRLESVRLILDDAKILHDDQTIGRTTLALVSNGAIFPLLMGKYGKPASQKGSCGDVSTNDILRGEASCDASWSSEGQALSYTWSWFKTKTEDKLYLFITYNAHASGL